MKSIQAIVTTLIMVLAFADVSAKTVSWAISPKYDKLSRYSTDIFVFQQNGKWGLVKPGGVVILQASYEYITPFINGYSLAGIKEGSRYLLQAIISETGDVSHLNEKLYLPSSNQYFSGGKMVVSNHSGKFGYIDAAGRIVIRCQFDHAFPFREGWAPVKQGNYFKYINDTYDSNPSRSILVVDFHYGEMTLASCIANGYAAVAYNRDFALIGANGQELRELNETEFKQIYKNNNSIPKLQNRFSEAKNYVECIENGLLGLKQGSELVAIPQFNSFPSQFDDGYVIAADKSGLQGLLMVSDGNYTIDMTSASGSSTELDVDRKGIVEGINLNIALLSTHNNLKLIADCGNGIKQDITSQLSVNGTTANAFISPSPMVNAENCEISVILENDGIIVAEASNNFTISYPIKLRVSAPGNDTIRANASDDAAFSSIVFNDSNKSVEVTATWSTGRRITKTIPANGRATFTDSIKVYEKHTQTIRITLDTGESNSRTICFEPFF